MAAVVAAALVALGLFLFVLNDEDPTAGEGTGSPTSSPLPDRDGCVEVIVAASPEKAGVLAANVEAYNATDPQVGGSCVVADVLRKGSGTAAAALARGWDEQADGPFPTVWSPAASAWGEVAAV